MTASDSGDSSPPSSQHAKLAIDRGEISRFVHALFPHLDPWGYVSLRAFRQFRPKDGERDRPLYFKAVRLNLGLEPLIDAAERISLLISNGDVPGVFASPICTFIGRTGAKTCDVLEAPVLSVEIDQGDLERATDALSLIIGERPTIVLHSGSLWADPATGDLLPKGHLHWRLKRPARGPEPLRMLRRARDIATLIAGGDPTGTPPVHPLRFPGTWNRKVDPPVMARIIEETATTIDLAEALAALEDAAEGANLAAPKNTPHLAADDLPAELAQLAEWLTYYTAAHLPPDGQGLRHEWNKVAMAIHRATTGSEDGFKLFRDWSGASASPFYTEAGCRRRWDAITGCPPTWIGARWLRSKAVRHGWVLAPPTDWDQAHPLNEGHTEVPQGRRKPKPVPDDREQPIPTPEAGPDDEEEDGPGAEWMAEPGGQEEPPPRQSEYDDFVLPIEFSENALSYLFSSRHQDRLVYVHGWGKWLRYHAGRWHEDHTVRVYDAARAIRAEEGERARRTLPVKSGNKVAAIINKAGCIAAIERLARHHEPQTRALDLFDADQSVVGTPNHHSKLHRNRKE